MLKAILSFLVALIPLLIRIFQRKPALKVEEVVGGPEAPTYTETAQAQARAEADAKFGSEDKAG